MGNDKRATWQFIAHLMTQLQSSLPLSKLANIKFIEGLLTESATACQTVFKKIWHIKQYLLN